MFEATRDEYDEMLGLVEERLLELADSLDTTVPDHVYPKALLLLGVRSRALFRGFTTLATARVLPAAVTLLRPMIEVNLTLRFIQNNPELHAEVWIAEGELQTLKLIRELMQDKELVAKHGEIDMTEDWFTERESFVADVRARALKQGVKGVGTTASSAVMPNMQVIASAQGDLATREAYTLAYRSLNQDMHVGSRAFMAGAFSPREDGRVGFVELEDPEGELRRHRALNSTTFASTLLILSDPLGLDLKDEAEAIRHTLVSASLSEDDEADR